MMNTQAPSATNQQTAIQLHDIHVPEQVSNFPIAPGWWILLALIIFAALWSYKKYKENDRLNASKKQAQAILANNENLSAKECLSLLKWAAMEYVNRQAIAKLYGEHLQSFLVEKLPEKHQNNFTKLISPAFDSQYQAEQASTTTIDRDCQQATKLWLTHALPIQHSFADEDKAELSQ